MRSHLRPSSSDCVSGRGLLVVLLCLPPVLTAAGVPVAAPLSPSRGPASVRIHPALPLVPSSPARSTPRPPPPPPPPPSSLNPSKSRHTSEHTDGGGDGSTTGDSDKARSWRKKEKAASDPRGLRADLDSGKIAAPQGKEHGKEQGKEQPRESVVGDLPSERGAVGSRLGSDNVEDLMVSASVSEEASALKHVANT